VALLTKNISAWIVSMVQDKRFAEDNTVGSGTIRDFFGSLDRFRASKGLFVTSRTFSPSAGQTATN
jgi:restriction system protein